MARRGIDDLAKALQRISKDFDRVTNLREPRVTTKTEWRQENERLREEAETEQNER